MLWRALSFSLLVSSLLGCVALPELGRCLSGLDGGLADGGVQGCEPPDDVDAENPPVNEGVDAGAEPAGDLGQALACNNLVADVCGVGDPPPCEDNAPCAAAKLLQRYEPAACQDAASNDVTYPECRPGPCALLVDRVCGGPADDAACSEAPGCEPAKVLLVRSTSADAAERSEAEASCNAALEDDVVFALCQSDQ